MCRLYEVMYAKQKKSNKIKEFRTFIWFKKTNKSILATHNKYSTPILGF